MLLRSSSTPIMNSWVPPHSSSSSDNSNTKNDQFTTISTNCNLPRTRSLSMITTASLSTTSSSDHWNFPRPLHQTSSTHSIIPTAATPAARVNKCQTTCCHLPLPRHPPRTSSHRNANSPASTDKNQTIKSSYNQQQQQQRLNSNSGLSGLALASAVGDDRTGRMTLLGEDAAVVCAVAEGGGSDRGNNNRISGGGWGGSSDGQDGWSNYSDGKNGNNGGHETTEAYYQRMIDANPSNALLLGNYAKFLKEVKGDIAKAEEYCERAILASPAGDGNVLSLYADIIWETKKDANRAETYFDQAVQSSPDDCYVLASYAKFLWDSEEEEDEEEQQSSWTAGIISATS